MAVYARLAVVLSQIGEVCTMKAIWNGIKDGSLSGDARMNQRSFKQAKPKGRRVSRLEKPLRMTIGAGGGGGRRRRRRAKQRTVYRSARSSFRVCAWCDAQSIKSVENLT